MGVGKISIERQHMLTFGDALCSVLGQHVGQSQEQMRTRMVRNRRQSFGQFPFGRRQGRDGIFNEEKYSLDQIRACRSNERIDIAGVGGERAIIEASRPRDIVGGIPFVEPGQALEIEAHRIGARGLLRASRLGGDKLGVQLVRQARDDFVLHVEEIGHRLIETLGSEMGAALRVNELDAHAHAVPAALNAALQNIADVQLATGLLQIDGFVLVRKSRVAPDHERAANP